MLEIAKEKPEASELLLQLLDDLEKRQHEVDVEGGRAAVSAKADELYERANGDDQAGIITTETATTYYAGTRRGGLGERE